MITEKQFTDRVQALWHSQQTMAAEKKWKTGKREGGVRQPALTIWFTKAQLEAWLREKVGLQARPCPYCGVLIDILNCVPDHVVPRQIGGQLSLDNMELICKDDNQMKGPMSKAAFTALRHFIQTLSGYDQGVIRSRLKAAHHGAAQRFFRKPADKEAKKLPPPVKPKPLNFDPF